MIAILVSIVVLAMGSILGGLATILGDRLLTRRNVSTAATYLGICVGAITAYLALLLTLPY